MMNIQKVKKSFFISVAVLTWMGIAVIAAPETEAPEKTMVGHGFAMHGAAKYGPGFQHFDYVNPSAPKYGTATFVDIGTFDTLHPHILKGLAAPGIGLMFESLGISSTDEAFSMYGCVAESMEIPEDRSWVAFSIHPKAKFHDGTPITADDVVFTFEALTKKGHPFYRAYYSSVSKAEKIDALRVKFSFNQKGNRELPLIVSQLPVLSKLYWSTRDFEKSSMEIPVGSGPYTVESFEVGRSITYKRVKDWWGASLPINVGRFNYDVIKYKCFKDSTVALEAFKAGEYDFRAEDSAKNWATAYDFPALKQGRVKREKIPNENPKGMQSFVMNTRRPIFQHPKVRQALAYAFDFEWMNSHFFYGEYARTKSYFEGSDLASKGLPKGEELDILKKFKGKIPEEVFTREYAPPVSDGSGEIRERLREAKRLLQEAGWTVDKSTKQLTHQTLKDAKGNPMVFEFEVLLISPLFEKIVNAFASQLKILGIGVKVRTVDASQYENRLNDFDFDMISHTFQQSLSPGNEQRDFWSSSKRNMKGGTNYAGVNDPVVDALVELVITAGSRESLVARTRALDRVLLWSHYVIPCWNNENFRVAYWNKFSRPTIPAKYNVGEVDTWWVDPVKENALKSR